MKIRVNGVLEVKGIPNTTEGKLEMAKRLEIRVKQEIHGQTLDENDPWHGMIEVEE